MHYIFFSFVPFQLCEWKCLHPSDDSDATRSAMSSQVHIVARKTRYPCRLTVFAFSIYKHECALAHMRVYMHTHTLTHIHIGTHTHRQTHTLAHTLPFQYLYLQRTPHRAQSVWHTLQDSHTCTLTHCIVLLKYCFKIACLKQYMTSKCLYVVGLQFYYINDLCEYWFVSV